MANLTCDVAHIRYSSLHMNIPPSQVRLFTSLPGLLRLIYAEPEVLNYRETSSRCPPRYTLLYSIS
jgi:hypothetical protein